MRAFSRIEMAHVASREKRASPLPQAPGRGVEGIPRRESRG
jgi:hypothetical protein